MSKPSANEKSYARWRWAIFWIAAAALLLFALGARSLWGSEDRWAEVVREMFLSGDFLHPRINWEPYFDKPLISYWFIALCAWIKGGVVDEFASRLPSALAALLSLAAVASLGKRLISPLAAYYSCWILLTVYSFAFWGRTAAADMENVAFTFAALAWYFARKERPGFLSYFVFWALCAIGGQTKGLGAIAIPVALALVDMLLDGWDAALANPKQGKSWKSLALASFKGLRRHFSWQSILALLAGVFVYFIPFILEAATRGSYSSSGLSLVFRENIQRFFDPFDHDEPFYMYFVWVPQLLLPWTPFVLLAAVWACKRWKSLAHGTRWICLAALATFLIFSVSGSRRVYYILPILPLCALLCGAWLDSTLRDARIDRFKSLLFSLSDWVFLVGAPLVAIAPLAVLWLKLKLGPVAPPPQILVAISICGAMAMLFRALVKWRLEEQERCKALAPGFLRFAVPVWIVLFCVYSLVIPSFDAFRTGKPFAKTLASSAAELPPENLVFIRKASASTIFYMGTRGRAEVMDSPEELSSWLAKPLTGLRMVVSEQGALDSLPPELRARLGFPVASEPLLPWEKSAKRKLQLLLIPENFQKGKAAGLDVQKN